jgi:hypothetical protein
MPSGTTGTYTVNIKGTSSTSKTSSTSFILQVSPNNTDPVAEMECQIIDCKGPGCICTAAVWETYNPISGVNYVIKNKSHDAENNIVKSTWSVDGTATDCPSGHTLCDLTIVSPISSGTHIIKLKVTDSYNRSSETAPHTIKIKQDIIADFDCSLDDPTAGPQIWISCQDPNLNLMIGNTVYFWDKSTASGCPSACEAIEHWIWEKDGAVFDSTDNPTPSLPITGTTIRLTVTDSIGRTDSISYPLSAALPLPKWIEIPPFQ